MKTDYKFWYIRRNDDGFIEEAAVRFYEGEITIQNELNNETFVVEPVNRYRRIKQLDVANDLKHLKSQKTKKDITGKDAVLYTVEDFGNIKTDDELRVFLNSELKKDVTRTPIPEQNEQGENE